MYSAISFFPLVLPLILSLPVQALSSFTGLLTVEAPSEQRSIVWPHNLTEGNGQMSYNGKGTVFKLGYGKTTRKYDRFDMALIGEDTAGKLTSFKYVVCQFGLIEGKEESPVNATVTLLNPGPSADANSVFVRPSVVGDYTASCSLAALPAVKTA